MNAAADLVVMAEPLSLPASLDVLPVVSVSGEARRLASAILEVLAGMRSITDIALALGVTPARYYALEARAVGGLIAACEPRGPGPNAGAGLPAELERLRAERDRLKAEAARYQTLARIAQGAFALPMAPAAASSGTTTRTTSTKRPSAAIMASRTTPERKKRRPTVRALRMAARVRDAGAAGGPPAGSTSPLPSATPAPGQLEDRAP